MFRGRQLAFISRTGSRQDLSDICQIRAYQTRASTTNRERTKSCTKTRLPIYASFSSFVYRTLSLSLSYSHLFLLSFTINQRRTNGTKFGSLCCTHRWHRPAQTCSTLSSSASAGLPNSTRLFAWPACGDNFISQCRRRSQSATVTNYD